MPKPLAVQLYTFRDTDPIRGPRAWASTGRRSRSIAEMGYLGVETVDVPGGDPVAARQALADVGLAGRELALVDRSGRHRGLRAGVGGARRARIEADHRVRRPVPTVGDGRGLRRADECRGGRGRPARPDARLPQPRRRDARARGRPGVPTPARPARPRDRVPGRHLLGRRRRRRPVDRRSTTSATGSSRSTSRTGSRCHRPRAPSRS